MLLRSGLRIRHSNLLFCFVTAVAYLSPILDQGFSLLHSIISQTNLFVKALSCMPPGPSPLMLFVVESEGSHQSKLR